MKRIVNGSVVGSDIPRRDLAWKHCILVEGNINETICNYCRLLMKSGGIIRFKFHLSHINPHFNTKKCSRVPLEEKEELRELLHKKKQSKSKESCRC